MRLPSGDQTGLVSVPCGDVNRVITFRRMSRSQMLDDPLSPRPNATCCSSGDNRNWQWVRNRRPLQCCRRTIDPDELLVDDARAGMHQQPVLRSDDGIREKISTGANRLAKRNRRSDKFQTAHVEALGKHRRVADE